MSHQTNTIKRVKENKLKGKLMQQAYFPLLSHCYEQTRTITQEEHMIIICRFLLQSALIFFCCHHIPAMTQVSFPSSGLPRTHINIFQKVASFAPLIYLPPFLTREVIVIQCR